MSIREGWLGTSGVRAAWSRLDAAAQITPLSVLVCGRR
jgi:hypothetical protein